MRLNLGIRVITKMPYAVYTAPCKRATHKSNPSYLVYELHVSHLSLDSKQPILHSPLQQCHACTYQQNTWKGVTVMRLGVDLAWCEVQLFASTRMAAANDDSRNSSVAGTAQSKADPHLAVAVQSGRHSALPRQLD